MSYQDLEYTDVEPLGTATYPTSMPLLCIICHTVRNLLLANFAQTCDSCSIDCCVPIMQTLG